MARTLKGINPKDAVPSRPKILIFGPPGSGKTFAAIQFPSVYYIDTEGGADGAQYIEKLRASKAAYLGPKEGSCEFATVLEEIQTLATTQHPYKTLVIDSFSKLFNSQIAATQEAMERTKTEDAFGASKKPAIQYTRRLLAWLQKLDMNVVLIHHQKSQWKDGKEVGVTFDGWDKTEYELHLALRIQKSGTSRKAFIGKSRLVSFPEGESFDWSYESFAAKWGTEAIEKQAAIADVANAEQVGEYHTLLTKIKVDPSVLEKWAAACDDPALLDAATIQKRIDWLKKQSAP